MTTSKTKMTGKPKMTDVAARLRWRAVEGDASSVVIEGFDVVGVPEDETIDVVIPSEIEGKKVVAVVDWDVSLRELPGEDFNQFCTRSLTLPKTVERFEFKDSFGLFDLREIKVERGNPFLKVVDGILYSKKGDVLIFCPGGVKLERFSVPSTVKKIAKSAFADCETLKSIEFPDGLEEIGDCAFAGCRALTSIKLPQSLTQLGDGAFSACNALRTARLPTGVAELGGNPFDACLRLTKITTSAKNDRFKDVDGVLYSQSGDVLIAYPAGRKDERFVVPDGVEKIGNDAFSGCRNLKEVALPESVKEIDKFAFYACDALERVALSDGITTIGESAFECCENLESIVLPKGLTELGDYAFSYCLALKKIGVPKGVKTIGEGTFNICEALESATLPAGLESIGEIAFAGCDVLANIKLPKGVKSLGEAAFLGCQALKSVDLPESLTQIGDEAFDAVPDDCAFRVVPGSFAEKWSRENHRRVESRKR